MKSIEAAFSRLERANPAPSPEQLPTPSEEQLARWLREERKAQMTVEVKPRPSVDKPRSALPKWLGVTAVVALGVGLLIALRAVSTEAPPADRSPEETATLFMAAMSQLDLEGTTSLFAEDVVVFPAGYASLAQDWPTLLDWYRASGWKHNPGRCSEVASLLGDGDVSTFYCEYFPTNAWSVALGHEVTTPDRFVLDIENGLIVRLENQDVGSSAQTSFSPAWRSFMDWVEANHPEDLEVMFEDDRIALIQSNDGIE